MLRAATCAAARRGLRSLVGVDLGVGRTGVVVNGGVDAFVADSGAGAGAAASDAVTAVHGPAAAGTEPAGGPQGPPVR